MKKPLFFTDDFIEEQLSRFNHRRREESYTLLYKVATFENGKPIRDKIEHWASGIPKGVLNGLIPKIKNSDHFSSAVNELLVAYYFSTHDFSLIYEPHFDGKTPDFLVQGADGDEAVVEVYTLNLSQIDKSLRNFKQNIRRHIGKIPCGVVISINYHGLDEALSSDDCNTIVKALKNWLLTNNPQEGDSLTITGIEFRVDRCNTGVPHCQVGSVISGMRERSYSRLRRYLRKKVDNHGEIVAKRGLPYFVAFLIDPYYFLFNDDDLCDVLLGNEAVRIYFDFVDGIPELLSHELVRIEGGLFAKSDYPLNGVLWFKEQNGSIELKPFLNPNARIKISKDFLQALSD